MEMYKKRLCLAQAIERIIKQDPFRFGKPVVEFIVAFGSSVKDATFRLEIGQWIFTYQDCSVFYFSSTDPLCRPMQIGV